MLGSSIIKSSILDLQVLFFLFFSFATWSPGKHALIGIAVMPMALFVIYFNIFFGYRVDALPRLENIVNGVSPWLCAILCTQDILLCCLIIRIAIKVVLNGNQTEDIGISKDRTDPQWFTCLVSSIFLPTCFIQERSQKMA